MRIASLVPSATETLYALGLGDNVVAVTHECDYPPPAGALPHLTRSVVSEDLATSEIDAAVRELVDRGDALYELDAELLHELRPDLIVTQALCAVCAVSAEDVHAVAARVDSKPRVVSLDPTTLGEVLQDVRAVAQAAGAPEAADPLLARAADRLDRVRAAVAGAPRPSVVALEWLDPPFVGGHWVPQMIDLAGGEDALGRPGERSRTASWDEIRSAAPDVAIAMLCGYDADRCARESREKVEAIAATGARRLVAVDAAGYFSRPGPRLVDGVELLAHVLHPELVGPPEGVGAAIPVELDNQPPSAL